MKTITVKYEAGHSYTEQWEHDADLFCPHCGEKAVWVEQGPGDYYVGNEHLCLSCRWSFCMPHFHSAAADQYDGQRIDKLLSEGSDA